ncbi:MAG: hypothetical protein FJ320_00190 [SAR202 cluster bacterium]|nr:hypothetical protein [SAR202 cluster bacterium]
MGQVIQIIGALMILAAYTASQARLLNQHTYTYLILNFVGSAVLAVLAAEERQWGFLLLEGVWGAVSLWGLVGRMRGRTGAAAR